MSNVEVMNLNVICRDFFFPQDPVGEIYRDHLLDEIDSIFKGDTHLVLVEGSEGKGKTTLLSQFARRHADNAISMFINPASRLAYAPNYLGVILSEQLHWALYKERLNGDADESYWRTNWLKLQRRAQKKQETYFFVIDGLAELPQDDFRIKEYILRDILPLGVSVFRFLLSGTSEQFSEYLHKSVRSKSFPLAPFSLDETEKYFTDLRLDNLYLKISIKRVAGEFQVSWQ